MESRLFERLKALFFALPSRRARPASLAYNLFKTALQSFVLWLVFLAVLPLLIAHIESWLRTRGWFIPHIYCPLSVTIALFCAGAAIAWASAWTLVRFGEGTPLPVDSTNKLVIKGPYRYVRNPMALSSLIQAAAVGLALSSPLVILYALCGGVLWNFTVRLWEERDMEIRFGDDFHRYRQSVRCWLPRLRTFAALDK